MGGAWQQKQEKREYRSEKIESILGSPLNLYFIPIILISRYLNITHPSQVFLKKILFANDFILTMIKDYNLEQYRGLIYNTFLTTY